MTQATRRLLIPIIAGMLACIGICLTANTAHAQCTQVTVTNNVGCDLTLCLYDNLGVSPICWRIPAGPPPTVINFPAGFNPVGGYSGTNIYPFDPATGCTACYSQITVLPVICCAVVCYNSVACTITINPCTTPKCGP